MFRPKNKVVAGTDRKNLQKMVKEKVSQARRSNRLELDASYSELSRVRSWVATSVLFD